jgi:hypothetical protein
MSSAFVKEGEARHLKDVAPNIGALLFFCAWKIMAP